MKKLFTFLIIFQLVNLVSVFAQRSERRLFVDFGINQLGISNNIFDGGSAYISADEHLIYTLPEMSNRFGYFISIGVETSGYVDTLSVTSIILLRYSRTVDNASWSGPDFIDFKWSGKQAIAEINSVGLEGKLLLSQSGIRPYILAGLTHISMDVEKGAGSYWELGYPRTDVFIDNFDTHYSLYDISAGLGLLLKIFSIVAIDGNVTIKYQGLLSAGRLKNFESSNGFAIGFNAGLVIYLTKY